MEDYHFVSLGDRTEILAQTQIMARHWRINRSYPGIKNEED
jgi:hypothetical protein